MAAELPITVQAAANRLRPRPLTWLLLAAAGWALLLWLLALLSMGARIGTSPADPGLAQPLPSATAAPAEPLAGPQDYAEAVRRPLFFGARRPLPFVLAGSDDDAADDFDFVLTGVLIAPGARIATLQRADGSNGPRVREGEAVAGHGGWRLQELAPRSAVFVGPDGERRLELRKFTGDGEAPATLPPALPPAPPRPSAATAEQSTAVPPPELIEAVPPSRAVAASAEPARPAPQAPAKADTEVEQSQVDAIRRRIQARREQLRANPPPSQPPSSP